MGSNPHRAMVLFHFSCGAHLSVPPPSLPSSLPPLIPSNDGVVHGVRRLPSLVGRPLPPSCAPAHAPLMAPSRPPTSTSLSSTDEGLLGSAPRTGRRRAGLRASPAGSPPVAHGSAAALLTGVRRHAQRPFPADPPPRMPVPVARGAAVEPHLRGCHRASRAASPAWSPLRKPSNLARERLQREREGTPHAPQQPEASVHSACITCMERERGKEGERKC
ncbi:hypothetical protein GQ55_9G345600 [Panicum hallii var. hallii]|uniref:Uncharacterized protein n=1 Tax=Panicum hallii var. hallii TaxID=1504633 RepID=A0A2T7C8H2_9POAL|nr:hypothetical protein GQ55_9G345600 [Panicum hallii var. hallii]